MSSKPLKGQTVLYKVSADDSLRLKAQTEPYEPQLPATITHYYQNGSANLQIMPDNYGSIPVFKRNVWRGSEPGQWLPSE